MQSGYDYHCESAEDKKARLAGEEKYRAEQKRRDDEREAKSRRYRKGWTRDSNCYNCGVKDFEYSADWKYLIPKQAAPPPVQSISPWILNGSTNIASPMTSSN